ncbi:Gfo/Idh/MocA family oxidoreductase [Arthrobacter sp. lap29]|uniref:Gfo/Idh/MocA family protein n=1 Tax=Arthrobacter sp. lap29 TaxID=3056122 RepID=UPI0028F6FB96|nr:Gfo/Idh/MocA family oxidoreductase [Arthrobacter sp. lap29]
MKDFFVEQLRVGLIGAGGIAGVHIAGWQQLGAQVSVYSRSGAAGLVARYAIKEVHSLEDLFQASDLISILTPTPSHHGYAMAAIAAGKDVICEKPLAENAARAAEILRAARAAGTRLFPAHVVRFFPEYAAAKAAVEAARRAGGAEAASEPAVLALSRSSAGPAEGSWFYNEDLGGGIIRDQMIHDIDQACWLAGEVISVEAYQNPPSVESMVPRPVRAQVILKHRNGALSTLHGEWGMDGLPFSTSVSIEAANGGTIFAWPEGDMVPASVNEPGDYLPVQDVVNSPYTLQNAEFAAARASGEPARVSPYDGVMAVALTDAAYASIALGRAVEFSAAAVQALVEQP